MIVTIDLSADLESTLRKQAAKKGQDVNAFVIEAIQEKIAKARSFEEVGAPIAQAVAATGIDEEEVDRFFDEARNEVWQEKHGKLP